MPLIPFQQSGLPSKIRVEMEYRCFMTDGTLPTVKNLHVAYLYATVLRLGPSKVTSSGEDSF